MLSALSPISPVSSSRKATLFLTGRPALRVRAYAHRLSEDKTNSLLALASRESRAWEDIQVEYIDEDDAAKLTQTSAENTFLLVVLEKCSGEQMRKNFHNIPWSHLPPSHQRYVVSDQVHPLIEGSEAQDIFRQAGVRIRENDFKAIGQIATQMISRPANLPTAPVAELDQTNVDAAEKTAEHAKQIDGNKQKFDECLQALMTCDGAVAACFINSVDDTVLGETTKRSKGAAEVALATLKFAQALGVAGNIEDMLITYETQYLILRAVSKSPEIFFGLMLSKPETNLFLARKFVKDIDDTILFTYPFANNQD